MSNRDPEQTPEPRLADVDWLIEIGLVANRHQAYRLARESRIPGVVRVGRRLLIDKPVLTRFIEEGGRGLSSDSIGA